MNDEIIQSLGVQEGYEDPLTLFLFKLQGVFGALGGNPSRRQVVRIAIYSAAPAPL